MKVRLVILPPGGGEADCSFFIDMPAVPASGDYISVQTNDEPGFVSLLVKRAWWTLKSVENRSYFTAGDERYGSTEEVSMDSYPAVGLRFDTGSHKRTFEMYCARGKFPPEFDIFM